MLKPARPWACLGLSWLLLAWKFSSLHASPTQIVVDTDVNEDDVMAILYLLKQNPAYINLKAITISANAWSDPGQSINLIYDLLHMMGRDDIPVGVGGEGGITFTGKFSPNVGGYLPLIEQRLSTWGGCRYRQAIPLGSGGLLDIDTMYGIRKQFLPQGNRHYIPLTQPTAQAVLTEAISSGPTVVMLIGSHTNFATFLMTHPELKNNVERLYIMGGGVNSSNPTGCCPKGSPTSCIPTQCGDNGNVFTAVDTNPWAEYNMFSDPFAAYQVLHSGIPTTLVPLDATNTIPISKEFLSALEKNQHTYEAQWVYQVLKITKDTWFDDNFEKEYFMWDSFTSGVAVSGILTNHDIEKNKFCVLHYKNVTVITSNKPYEAQDGSNPFFDDHTIPEFNLQKGGVHSGHVQTGLQDPFCLVPGKHGKCMDGYTMETTDPEGVRMQVGVSAKHEADHHKKLGLSFQNSFIETLNAAERTGLYNFETQFRCYKEVFYKPKESNESLGKPLIFDMDISPGDIITLFYLLKLPRKFVDLKAITVSPTGWSNAATIDIVYDILHMMGRDDIPIGLGELFAIGEAYLPSKTTGNCRYRQSIPNGVGGLLDSDTLFGLARDLPRSPRRYTAENSVEFGAPRNTDHPDLRQPKAQEVIENVLKNLSKNSKATFLTGGPLTNIATFLASNSSLKSLVEEIFIAGGSIDVSHHSYKHEHLGNVFTIPENTKSEFNFFLDPQAAKSTLESDLKVSLIPLEIIRKSSLFKGMMNNLEAKKETPEADFVHRLLLTIHQLQMQSKAYSHTEKLMEEVLAAVTFIHRTKLKENFKVSPMVVMASGDIATDGWTKVSHVSGKPIRYLDRVDSHYIERKLVKALNEPHQAGIIGSFAEQAKQWNTCHA